MSTIIKIGYVQQYPLVSVIVPCYNVEKYIDRCLTSIFDNGYSNLEIICVDDRSTDSTVEHIKNLQKRYKNIQLYHNETDHQLYGGGCRNIGLKHVTGKYVYFCDSDDYVSSSLISKCVQQMEKTNSEICVFRNYVDEGTTIKVDKLNFRESLVNKIKNGVECFSCRDIEEPLRFISPEPWNKFFSKKFLMDNHIVFQELHNSNDTYFSIMAQVLGTRITYLDEPLYYYRKNNSTVTINNSFRYGNDIFLCMLAYIEFLMNDDRTKSWITTEHIQDSISHRILYWIDTRLNNKIGSIYYKQNLQYLVNFIDQMNEKYNIDLLNIPKIKFTYDKFNSYIKNKPSISIIVPIYNTEKYVCQCLCSIMKQTHKDIEVICVNDGSTDMSPSIVEQIMSIDSRFRMINISNHGYGYAINTGIKYSIGKYIGIVESDDWIEDNMYEVLFNETKKVKGGVDIVKSGFFKHFNDKTSILKPIRDGFNYYGKIMEPVKSPNKISSLVVNIWSSIYRRDFLIDKNVLCNETPNAAFQDNGFFVKSTYMAKTIICLDKPLYHYRCFDNPTQSTSVQNARNSIKIVTEWKLNDQFFMNAKCLDDELLKCYIYRKIESYMYHFKRIEHYPQDRLDFIKCLKQDTLLNDNIDSCDFHCDRKQDLIGKLKEILQRELV